MNTDQKNLNLNDHIRSAPLKKTYIYDNHKHRPEKLKSEPITLGQPVSKKTYVYDSHEHRPEKT